MACALANAYVGSQLNNNVRVCIVRNVRLRAFDNLDCCMWPFPLWGAHDVERKGHTKGLLCFILLVANVARINNLCAPQTRQVSVCGTASKGSTVCVESLY